MIEKYQELLLEFTDRTLIEFWSMTETETAFYIKVGRQKLQNEIDLQIQLHTDLVISVMNSPYGPYLKRGEKYPFDPNKYLNKKSGIKTEISEKDKAKTWDAAGKAMMRMAQPRE